MNIYDIMIADSATSRTMTFRAYLKRLLSRLWAEGDMFSGKRPFGESDWQYDVYAALIKNGLIVGKLDRDGYVDVIDIAEADKLIMNAIRKL